MPNRQGPRYADVCWRMRTYAGVSGRMLTYADVWLQGIASPFDDQIAKDLGRTLPKHARYESPDARRALGITYTHTHTTEACALRVSRRPPRARYHIHTYTHYRSMRRALGVSRLLKHTDVCSHMLTYADIYAMDQPYARISTSTRILKHTDLCIYVC
jgi:hypothetical protein